MLYYTIIYRVIRVEQIRCAQSDDKKLKVKNMCVKNSGFKKKFLNRIDFRQMYSSINANEGKLII